MNKITLIAAFFFFVSSPAAAQVTSRDGQAASSSEISATGTTTAIAPGSAPASAQAPRTGVFCIEEMTANFCNTVTGPNTGGYGARGGSGSRGGSATNGSAATGGAGGGTASIPPCPAEPPFNELCN